ncbi:MAG: beta-propeller domain-containing protein [Lachnospiraceae bacterium]|nr:beta-propeller domain-containing protein [Lachnospiraceae bacterium]
MKEQDFMNHIKQETNDLPIPDSISPQNMKNMLEDYKQTQEHFNEDTPASSESDPTGSRHNPRYMKIGLTAACLALCVVGGVYSTHLSKNAPAPGTSATTESFASSLADSNELAAEGQLTSPDSYEDYYKTMKDAYDAYYDSISSVVTDETDMAVEEAADTASGAQFTGIENYAADATNKMAVNESADTTSSNSYSKTNTQEENVDEGDMIKTDGTYIYRMSQQYDTSDYSTIYKLSITQTDNGNMNVLYNMDLKDILSITKKDVDLSFEEFYLQKDTLYVLYTKTNTKKDTNRTQTYIAVITLADKSQPKLIRNLSQSGYYVSSRISDGYLYTISNFCDTSLETEKEYGNYIPSINDDLIECSKLYYPNDIIMESTYVITSLPLDDPTDFKDQKAFASSGGDTYVSESAIYLYCTQYRDITQTEISQITYKDGFLTVGNTTTVAGYFYDSFALSEKDGYLRMVATIPANNITLFRNIDIAAEQNSDSSTAVTEDVNALYILDSHMKLAAKLTGIAPGEQIYSARFIGDMGYFVTYENTDPLFSVDLSDPHNPKIVGKLKIPGFSNYLHPYSNDLLLGIGEETDPDTQEFLGIKLSMFDINDPENVKEKDKYILKDSEYSPALYNHKAIMINAADNIFGFVYTSYNEKTSKYSYYFATYTYDSKNGFEETAHYSLSNANEYEMDSVRGIYIGDYLYISTDEQITSYALGSTDPIATVYTK